MWRWRLFLGSGFAINFVQFIGVALFAESPRGSVREFEHALQFVQEELEMKARLQRGFFGDIKEIVINPRVLVPFFTGDILGMTSQFTDVTAICCYEAPILAGIGMKAKKSVYAQIPLDFWSIASSILVLYVLDRFGRRFCYLVVSVPFVILEVVFGIVSFKLYSSSSRTALFLGG
eukprot:jgi/Galph1/5754/GphlegSOOS_G4396.1